MCKRDADANRSRRPDSTVEITECPDANVVGLESVFAVGRLLEVIDRAVLVAHDPRGHEPASRSRQRARASRPR
jgi:hypothetical protein